MTSLKTGDVVQMAPDCTNKTFAGCFMVVEEVADWGVKGYFPTLDGHSYPYREQTGRFHRVGAAQWMRL